MCVHTSAPTGRHQRGAAVFGDHRGTREAISGAEKFAVVHRRSANNTAEWTGRTWATAFAPLGTPSRARGKRRFRARCRWRVCGH